MSFFTYIRERIFMYIVLGVGLNRKTFHRPEGRAVLWRNSCVRGTSHNALLFLSVLSVCRGRRSVPRQPRFGLRVQMYCEYHS